MPRAGVWLGQWGNAVVPSLCRDSATSEWVHLSKFPGSEAPSDCLAGCLVISWTPLLSHCPWFSFTPERLLSFYPISVCAAVRMCSAHLQSPAPASVFLSRPPAFPEGLLAALSLFSDGVKIRSATPSCSRKPCSLHPPHWPAPTAQICPRYFSRAHADEGVWLPESPPQGSETSDISWMWQSPGSHCALRRLV